MTASVADLVEDRFESDAMRGLLAVSGVIGTWAGPRTPGTALVLLHHHVGDANSGGHTGAWGFARGGMGGVTTAMARAARSFGAEIRTNSGVGRIDIIEGRAAGVTLETGEEISAPVIATAHPANSFLRLVGRGLLPPDFVADIESWKSRSGTVKINIVVDRLPRFASHPNFDPRVHGGTIVLSESLDEVEVAFQEAVAEHPSTLPFADVCIPSVFDDSFAPSGHHIVSLFTRWVPHTFASGPYKPDLADFADRVVARMELVAPDFTESILHRQVIGPYEMEHEYGLVGGSIFHGELTPGQMFHCRPAAGFADLRTPIQGLYQAGSATHGGGGVTGIPGRNVVRQVLHDRRRARRRHRDAAR